jgi:hypothetical protein
MNNIKVNANAYRVTNATHGFEMQLNRKADYDLLVCMIETKTPMKYKLGGKSVTLEYLKINTVTEVFPLSECRVVDGKSSNGSLQKRIVFKEVVDEEYGDTVQSHLRWAGNACRVKYALVRDLNLEVPAVAFVPNPNSTLIKNAQGGNHTKTKKKC